MNYTGKTLDGKMFDSNTDPSKGHVQPFGFTLGVGQVIKGWDEGVQLLNLGSRATFFIPSGLAYGDRGAGAAIPPNAVLMFDVEVLSIDKK
jgi:FKBP-type peptidyl-prolyl cis-trans isomerase